MFDYVLPGGLPPGSRTVWSQTFLQPLVLQSSTDLPALTPFSYSVLAEIAGRAWYRYFDRLGFEPIPRARVLRQYEGRPYLNLTLSAQREAEQAGVEPLTLRVDGQRFPICKWEKPGFLATLKLILNQRKIDDTLKKLAGEVDAVTQQAKQWQVKMQTLRWTQAEILQIMEEIEPMAVGPFMTFFAARYHLEGLVNRLLWLTVDKLGYPANLALLQKVLGETRPLLEQDIADRLAALTNLTTADPATVAWLQAGDFMNWQQTLPNPRVVADFATLLDLYGHRCIGEGELWLPRWGQDPTPLFRRLLVEPRQTTSEAAQSESTLLAAVATNQRKEVQALLPKLHQLVSLQSRALHAFAYILAGTRRWALAAAKEAMLDQRLLQLEDVFFFELEEMKEMMTGEWNISALREIHTTCAKRKAEYEQWQQISPPPLLIGEAETHPQPADVSPVLANLWEQIGKA